MSLFRKALGLENEEMGKMEPELEHVFWVKVNQPDFLHGAVSAVKHKQIVFFMDKQDDSLVGGIIRVRSIETSDGEISYEMTIKQDHGTKGKTEVTIPATYDMYVQAAGLADEIVVKHRYVFKEEGSDYTWEVDAAPDGKSSYFPWYRVELEVPSMDVNVPEFPFETDETLGEPSVMQTGNQKDWEERSKELYEYYFVKKGPLAAYDKDDTQTVAKDSKESEE